MAKNLSNLDPAEVSLVPEGANQRRFLVLKSAEAQKAVEQVRNTPKSLMERVVNVLKSFGKKDDQGKDMEGEELSQGAQTALKATARILAPHKDEITDAHMDAIQEQVGIQGEGDKEPGEEDMKGAHEEASKAYKAHLEKKGFKKYPEMEMTAKAMPSCDDDEDDEEEEPVSKEAGAKVETKVQQPILKEDGSINLEAVPQEMRAFAEVVAKGMSAANERAATAEKKLEAVTKELSETRASVREKELVAKAASFKNLNQEQVLKTLRMADKAGEESFQEVCKMFEGQDKQIGEGMIFKEIGSGQSGQSAGANDAWAKIEKMAEGLVQKSGDAKLTQQAAIDQVLKTDEGQALYAQYKGGREKGA